MKDCVSLEIAKQLKGAGWKQDGSFVYRNSQFGWSELLAGTGGNEEWCAAPTIGELLEALPKGVDLHKERDDETRGEYSVGLDPYEQGDFSSADWHYAANPADALALLWMELKKKGIV